MMLMGSSMIELHYTMLCLDDHDAMPGYVKTNTANWDQEKTVSPELTWLCKYAWYMFERTE